jgi:hypothetical protein
MATYYDGDIDKDMEKLESEPNAKALDIIGREIGYGRAQQILQVLWANMLREQGLPTNGALFRRT